MTVTARTSQNYEEDGIMEARGPYHDFWLRREGEAKYSEYWDVLRRNDAPIRISDDVVSYLLESLSWIPTIDPANNTGCSRWGLNVYGPTVINRDGGEKLSEISGGWARIFAQGPEVLILTHNLITTDGEIPQVWEPYRCMTSRDNLVADLTLLSEFGRQAATGDWYVLHTGI